ncbi:MAG: sugar transferase, partial [bacterium]|nr:sugar transferase [bacterium]
AFDTTIGLVLSVVTLPIIILTAMVSAVMFGGIGIDRLERVGKGGEPFTLYRIRTGQPHTSDMRGRRRRVSDFIRRWSFDELPQLWNVALGRMSLVGPRPIGPDQVAGLDEWQRQRHDVKPGLTGLWQVEARGDGRQLLDNLHYDIQYLDQLSFLTDLRILGMTVGVWAARREGHPPDQRKRRRPRDRVNHLRLITTDLVLWPIAITA